MNRPKHCWWCGSASHTAARCPTEDKALGEEIREEEAAATKGITALLTAHVRRTRWTSVLIAAYRASCQLETRADAAELADLLKAT